ncbi:methylated-DNA--[protein]-cysteine S-methyltransferase [bacterium]|nr:MAG: methylated-DNA--[protein]-cysteine S-methyltransferase [bacterium]
MGTSDYERVEKAICYLEEHASEHPALEDVALHVGLSRYHFQRLFRRWAGVSPKRFLQFLTAEKAKGLLRESASVLETAYEVGLSGSGRLHDLFVSVEAVTPGQFKSRGVGTQIRYGIHDSPFGHCLIGLTEHGICTLWFLENNNQEHALEKFREEWQTAKVLHDHETTREIAEKVFSPSIYKGGADLRLFLNGTNFQVKVWQALLKIPEGSVVSYGYLARWLGIPNSARAVANAVAHNPVAYLIPCHRVLRSTGEIGGYRWGTARKKAMLGREIAHYSET